MGWAFQPVDDNCIECNTLINPKTERNYIVWGTEGEWDGKYKRECAACHDARTKRPYERRHSTDDLIVSTPPLTPPIE